MKAVAPRIDRLYESQAGRWRKQWERFYEQLWRPLSNREVEACAAFWGLSPERCAALSPVVEAWCREIGIDPEQEAAWDRFLNAFIGASDIDTDIVDLSRWPADVPLPPEDLPALWTIVRRDAGKGADECLAAGYVLFLLAAGRVARLYSRASSMA